MFYYLILLGLQSPNEATPSAVSLKQYLNEN